MSDSVGSGGRDAAASRDSVGSPRMIVTGGRGQLGSAIAGATHWRGVWPADAVIAPGRRDLDITDRASIAAALDRHAPEVVLNAAAYTDVDGAESDSGTAHLVNAVAPGILAEECAARGIRLVHMSTDYVFPGDVPGRGDPATAPALEPDDPTGPRTVYGRTKLEGEHAVLATHPEATIVRTAWVYLGPQRRPAGIAGGDFVDTMVRLERERDRLVVVDDQWGSPTYARSLALSLADMIRLEERGDVDTRGLTLHLAGGGRTTWCGLARAVFPWFGADPERITPCTTAEFPRPAPRPAFSVLSDASWRAAGMLPMEDWGTDLARALAHDGWVYQQERDS